MSLSTGEMEKTQAWILAGGRGERLYPLTLSRPKPGISFGGEFRIIDFTLSNCLHSGLKRVSLLSQYRHQELHRYVMDAWSGRWNNTEPLGRLPLTFLVAPFGKPYRGTADAVFQNSELLKSDSTDSVLILPSDHVYSMDYCGLLRQHAETGADLTIATVEYPLKDASQFGVVEVDANLKITGFEEKPAYPRPLRSGSSTALVSMGICVFNKDVLLESLRQVCQSGQGYDFARHIIPWVNQSGRTYAYHFRDDAQNCPRYWRDIGTIDQYYETSMELVQPESPFDPYATDCGHSHKRCEAGICSASYKRCEISRSVVSSDVQLHESVTIVDSVLMPGVRIGKGARLRRTIVGEDVHIPEGFEIGFDLDQDRQRYTVSKGGVVVVNRTPALSRPTVLYFPVGRPGTIAKKRDFERAAA